MKPVKPVKSAPSPTRQVIKEVRAAMGCLTGDLRTVAHTTSFTVQDGADTFTVTVERTTP